MKLRDVLAIIGVLLLSAGLLGCSFSASASVNSDGKAVLHGKDAILVKAAQPAPPPPPPPPKPLKPMKAKLVGKKIEITEKVMFEYNKAAIKVDSHQLLKDVAEVIGQNPQIQKIRVEGHTDSDGKDKYNKKLSQKRADAVKAFLVEAGIPADKLEAVGFGEERPVASNDTDEGKEANRRVEFNIIGEAAPAGDAEKGE